MLSILVASPFGCPDESGQIARHRTVRPTFTQFLQQYNMQLYNLLYYEGIHWMTNESSCNVLLMYKQSFMLVIYLYKILGLHYVIM